MLATFNKTFEKLDELVKKWNKEFVAQEMNNLDNFFNNVDGKSLDQQQREADEDVRSVQTGERVEDRALRMVLRGEADVRVLVDLDEQECGAEQERHQHARLQAETVALADGGLRPMHRERGRHEDSDEEVGGEESPEDHDLGYDEEQHPEQLGLNARAAVSGRWAVVLFMTGYMGDACGLHLVAAPSCC